jgi:hypothetical protein
MKSLKKKNVYNVIVKVKYMYCEVNKERNILNAISGYIIKYKKEVKICTIGH